MINNVTVPISIPTICPAVRIFGSSGSSLILGATRAGSLGFKDCSLVVLLDTPMIMDEDTVCFGDTTSKSELVVLTTTDGFSPAVGAVVIGVSKVSCPEQPYGFK